MLKTTRLLDESAPGRNNGSRLVFSRNNNNRPISEKNDNNSEVNRFGIGGNGVEHAKKSGKLKSQKLSKSQRLSKSGKSKSKKLAKSKKLLKSGNLPNFGTTEARPSFLTLDARTVFNRLWLAFTKAPIL